MTKIYHLALVTDWEAAKKNDQTYFPPTYSQDGFTHGTAEAARLLQVANHFYTSSQGNWVCLEMTEGSLQKTNVIVKYEPAAAVGNQNGQLDDDAPLFPHLFGGIHPDAVTATYAVSRDSDGRFLDILLDEPLA